MSPQVALALREANRATMKVGEAARALPQAGLVPEVVQELLDRVLDLEIDLQALEDALEAEES